VAERTEDERAGTGAEGADGGNGERARRTTLEACNELAYEEPNEW
jgi:hypothetical protein